MLNAAEALQIILDHTQLLRTEKVPLLSSLGRSIGQGIIVKEDIPPFDNSSMDGYAILSSDLQNATAECPSILTIVGESSAGNLFHGEMGSGKTVRVMTGGMIPSGADAVVPIEHATELDGDHVQFTEAIRPGAHVRARGEDVAKGDIALHSGQVLTPGAIGVLASLGFKRARVYNRPEVNIIATGDELVDVDEEPATGQVRNSSSYTLAANVVHAGGVPRIGGIVPDKRKRLRKAIKESLDAEVLLITGGVSVGRYDFVKEVLTELGVEIIFWKVNIKPGMPLVFGTYGKTLVFGLPGNPVSTGVTFLQFVKPALFKMCGREDVFAMKHSAVLDHEFKKSDGKRHYLRGIADRREGILHVVTTGTQSSGVMSSLSRANCLIVVSEETSSLRKGDTVDIEFL